MRKLFCACAALLALVSLAACGRGYVPMPTEPVTTEFFAETEVAAETSTQADTTLESTTRTTAQASKITAIKTTRSTTTTTQRAVPVAATQATTHTTQRSTTTTMRRTTTTTAVPTPQTLPSKPVYTEVDYAEIIAAVRQYAESKTAVQFVWDPSLTREKANQGLAGYHGMPNITRHSKKSVLDDLIYHVDLTEDAVSNPLYGVPSSSVHYHVYWFVDQAGIWGFGPGDTCLILVYG